MWSGSQNPAAAGASPGGRSSRLASRGRRKEQEHESVGARDGREAQGALGGVASRWVQPRDCGGLSASPRAPASPADSEGEVMCAQSAEVSGILHKQKKDASLRPRALRAPSAFS